MKKALRMKNNTNSIESIHPSIKKKKRKSASWRKERKQWKNPCPNLSKSIDFLSKFTHTNANTNTNTNKCILHLHHFLSNVVLVVLVFLFCFFSRPVKVRSCSRSFRTFYELSFLHDAQFSFSFSFSSCHKLINEPKQK